MLVVQEHDAEADDRDLRVHVNATPDGETPKAAVAKRAHARRGLELVIVSVPASTPEEKEQAEQTLEMAKKSVATWTAEKPISEKEAKADDLPRVKLATTSPA